MPDNPLTLIVLAASAIAGILFLNRMARVKLECTAMLREYERALRGARVAKQTAQQLAEKQPSDAAPPPDSPSQQ